MNWDTFKTEVLPYVPGCPWAMAKDHVIKAAREFAAKTLCIDGAFDFVTVADQANYTITPATGLELVKLLRVEVAGREYPVVNPFTGRASGRAASADVASLNLTTKVVTIHPAPSLAGKACYVDAAMRPTSTASECPDQLAQYTQDIAHGAIASLCAMPKNDWTSFDTSVMRDKQFKDRISTVGVQVSFGSGSRHPARVTNFY